MKDRVIKKLQDQVKTLSKTIEKGRKNNIPFPTFLELSAKVHRHRLIPDVVQSL